MQATNLTVSAGNHAIASVGGLADLSASGVSIGVSGKLDAVIGDSVTLSTDSLTVEAMSNIQATATDIGVQVDGKATIAVAADVMAKARNIHVDAGATVEVVTVGDVGLTSGGGAAVQLGAGLDVTVADKTTLALANASLESTGDVNVSVVGADVKASGKVSGQFLDEVTVGMESARFHSIKATKADVGGAASLRVGEDVSLQAGRDVNASASGAVGLGAQSVVVHAGDRIEVAAGKYLQATASESVRLATQGSVLSMAQGGIRDFTSFAWSAMDVFDVDEVQLNATVPDVVELSIDDRGRSAHVIAPHKAKYAIHRAHIDLYDPKRHQWVTVWDKIIGGTPRGHDSGPMRRNFTGFSIRFPVRAFNF